MNRKIDSPGLAALRYEHRFATACIPSTRTLNTGPRYETNFSVEGLRVMEAKAGVTFELRDKERISGTNCAWFRRDAKVWETSEDDTDCMNFDGTCLRTA